MDDVVAKLVTEIQVLKEEIKRIKEHLKIDQRIEPNFEPEQKKIVVEVKEKPHPRQGSYTPADVAIEKFFYFGKK